MTPRRRPCRRAGGRAPRGGARLGVVSISLVAGACLGTRGIVEERGRGAVRCYRAPFDAVWDAAEQGLAGLGLSIERANRLGPYLVARNYVPEARDPDEMALDADQGERVAVFLDDQGPDVWSVEVVSRPIFALDPSPRDWTRAVFLAIEQRLPQSARDPDEDVAACDRAGR